MNMTEMLNALTNMINGDETVEAYRWTTRSRITIHINDFEGFDDDGEEVMLDYNEELVERLSDFLTERCVDHPGRWSGDCWRFDGYEVELEFGSEDI